jgi:hypothetical protein
VTLHCSTANESFTFYKFLSVKHKRLYYAIAIPAITLCFDITFRFKLVT